MAKVIINADDFGYSQEVNEAICFCLKEKLINQTTLMVNMTYTEEAIQMAKSNGFTDKVGLHLNLIEGMPLSEAMSRSRFCDSKGYMNNVLIKNRRNRIYLSTSEKRVVAEEIRAQVKQYLDYGLIMKHFDSHQHVHNNISILSVMIPILREYGFKNIRLARNIPCSNISKLKRVYKNYVNNIFVNFNKNNGVDINSMVLKLGSQKDFELDKKAPEDVYEIMAHPIFCDGRLVDSVNENSVEDFLLRNGLKYYEDCFEFSFN